MAYEKTVWQKGMVLTAENLNKIENALEGITSVVSVETDSSGVNTTGTTTGSLSVSGTSTLGVTNISGATTIGTQETAANLTVNGNINGTNEISGNTLTIANLLSVGNSTAACTINNQGQIIASTITSIGSITASTITSNGAITGESLTINQDAVFKKNVILKNGEDTWMSLDPSGIIYAPNITFGASSSSTYITNSIFNHPHVESDSFTGAYETISLGYYNNNYPNKSSKITILGWETTFDAVRTTIKHLLYFDTDAYIMHAIFQDDFSIRKNNSNINTIYTFQVNDENNLILDSQIGEDSQSSVLTLTAAGDAYTAGDAYAGGSFMLSGRTQSLGIRPINGYVYTIGGDYNSGFFIRATTTSAFNYNHTLLSYAFAGTTISKPLPTIYLGTRSHTTDDDDIISQIYLEASNKIILDVSGKTDNEGVEIQSNLTLNTDNSLFILSNRTDTLGDITIESNYTIGAGRDGFWITENITSSTASDYTVLSLNHEVNNQRVYPNIYIGSPDNTTDHAVQNIFLEAAGQVVLQGGDSDGVKIDSNLYLPSGKTIKMEVSESASVELTADDITYLHQLRTQAQNGGE